MAQTAISAINHNVAHFERNKMICIVFASTLLVLEQYTLFSSTFIVRIVYGLVFAVFKRTNLKQLLTILRRYALTFTRVRFLVSVDDSTSEFTLPFTKRILCSLYAVL